MWNEVNDFIEATYNIDELERVYISGDEAAWIKAGTRYLPHALFCAVNAPTHVPTNRFQNLI